MTTRSTDFTFPLSRWAPMQPATIDPTLDLCTRYPLRLGGPRQCGMRSLPDTYTHGLLWESNPRPSDLESSALSIVPHAPKVPSGNGTSETSTDSLLSMQRLSLHNKEVHSTQGYELAG